VRARTKMANKGGNLFVYNDVSRSDIGFESDWNELVLITQAGERVVSRRSKEDCAVAILDEVEALLRGA
jgi:phosphopantothenoylcysteine decarboxylase / phosphopantothenate---cysteine ligase